MYLHLQVLSDLMTPKARAYFWRTTTGAEVDFVLEHGKKALAFEVKLTRKPTVRDARQLISFTEENPEVVRGILVHAGGTVRWLHSRVVAVPWWWLAVEEPPTQPPTHAGLETSLSGEDGDRG